MPRVKCATTGIEAEYKRQSWPREAGTLHCRQCQKVIGPQDRLFEATLRLNDEVHASRVPFCTVNCITRFTCAPALYKGCCAGKDD